MRLIRSKGVGVYFCSQFPDDVPDNILGQLGNRVQHALRAYHAARPESGEDRGGNLRPQPQAGRGQGDFRTGGRRGAGLDAAGQGHSDARASAPTICAAALPHGRHHCRRARRRARPQPGRRKVRHGSQSRVGVRDAGQARREKGPAARPSAVATKPPAKTTTAGRRNPSLPRSSTNSSGAPSVARARSKRSPSRRPARSPPAWAGRSCAACWAEFSAASARTFRVPLASAIRRINRDHHSRGLRAPARGAQRPVAGKAPGSGTRSVGRCRGRRSLRKRRVPATARNN